MSYFTKLSKLSSNSQRLYLDGAPSANQATARPFSDCREIDQSRGFGESALFVLAKQATEQNIRQFSFAEGVLWREASGLAPGDSTSMVNDPWIGGVFGA
jgi:hypothetical protein